MPVKVNADTVKVRAYSYKVTDDDGWSDEETATPMAGAMIPTPALPLFGVFALGAGVLAAGRRRLMNDWMRYRNRPQPQGVRCAAAQRRLLPGGRASRPRSLAGRPRLRRVASVMAHPAAVSMMRHSI